MKNIDMRKGPLLKQIILFAIPVILSGCLQNLFNVADMIVVGRFSGSNALAAVGATSSLCNTMINFFIGISVGSGIVAAHFFGADDNENISKIVNTSFYSSIFIGFFLIIIGLTLSKPLLKLMNTPENIIENSVAYIKIFFFGMPASMIFNFMNAISRSVGDTKRPMFYLVIAGIINVILNLIFVIRFDLSVKGVAISTVISQYISATLITIRFMHSDYPLKLQKGFQKFDLKILRKIFKLGLPAGIQSTTINISNAYIQAAVNFFGASAVAGFTAASNVAAFLYFAFTSIYQTNMTLTAQNYACGNFDRIKKGTVLSELTIIAIGIVLCSLAVYFKDPLLRLYTDDPLSLKTGYLYYNIISSTYFLCGIMEVLTGGLRGLGKSLESMVITLTTMVIFRITWNYTMFTWFKTLEVVFVVYPVSWIISIIILFFRLRFTIKKCESNYLKTAQINI